METAFNVNYSVMSKSTSNASAVLSSQCTQRTPLFTRIQVVFKRFKHSGLFSRQTVKGWKDTVVNRALSSLHGGSMEITLTLPLRLKKHQTKPKNP